MKLRQFVLDYLSFNRAEQRGLVVLMTLLLALLAVHRLWPAPAEELPIDVSSYDREIELFRLRLAEAEKAEASRQDSGRPWKKSAFYADSRSDTSVFPKRQKEPEFVIELNTTDTLELQRLRGIGSGYARRIIRYRDRLGGFISTEQLLEVPGLTADLFHSIRSHLTVNPQLVRRIDLNNATFKEMLKHPYFPYELTRAVFLRRGKVKVFRNVEDLRSVEGVSDSVFRKISRYLEVK